METHNRNVPGHTCSLPPDEDCIVRFIDGGIFVNLRRKFRQILIVDACHPDAKALLKSTAEIRKEEARHLHYYYNMIHPYSKFRTYWEDFMILVYFMLFIIIPFEIASVPTPASVSITQAILDVFSFIDIILFFVTGYVDQKKQRVLLKSTKVVRHYLLGYFIFDVLSSLPYNSLIYITNQYQLWYLRLFLSLKLVRMNTFLKYLQKVCDRMNLWSYNFTSIKCFFILLFLIMWIGGISHIIAIAADETNKHLYHSREENLTRDIYDMLQSSFTVIVQLFLVSYGTVPSDSDLYIAFEIFCMTVGVILEMICLAVVMQIYNRISLSRNKYASLVQQIQEYMKYKELPSHLQQKVLQLVDIKFQKKVYRETEIFNMLSPILRDDILMHSCKRLVEKVEYFQDVPTLLILRIVSRLQSEIYLPNDVIVQAGTTGNSMYFIYMGTVAVYTTTGKEICHLQDGDHFGEISLVINEVRVATVVAINECEVFRLIRKDFQEAIQPFPELSNKIRMSALRRLHSTQKLMKSEDVFSVEDAARI